MDKLNKKMAQGALWMTLLRFGVRSLGLVSVVILARLLVPGDFGLVAMATSIIAFLELATAFSFDIPLIQKKHAGRDHFDTAWTLTALFKGALAVLLVLLAKPAAAFYQDDRLVDIVYVLACGFFVTGFENIGVVYFRKDLDFRKDFVLMISKKLVGFLVTIPLAFYLKSYWALVIGIVVGNVGGTLLTYYAHPYRPRPSLLAAREMINFSKWLVLNNAVSFLRKRSPDFIVGRLAGPAELGLFTVSLEISTLPTTELTAPINRAVFPGYSKLAGDLPALKKSYLDVLAIIAIFALPIGLGISAVSTPLVDLVLGDQWRASAPLIVILAVYGALSAVQTNTGSVFNAIGKPQLITLVGTLNIALLLPLSIGLALRQGTVGVAIAYALTSAVIAPVTFFFIARELQVSLRDFLTVFWRPLVASVTMYAVVRALMTELQLDSMSSSAAALATLVPAGIVVYSGVVLALWSITRSADAVETRLLNLLVRRIKRATSR